MFTGAKILGPLELFQQGRIVPISAAKQRALLAVLLICRGQVVTPEQLIDELWGESPPASARGTLYSLISRLRRLLAQHGAATSQAMTLTGTGMGYKLQNVGDRVDSANFRALVGSAGEEIARDRYDQAHAYLEEALGLWRGPALVDVPPTPLVSAEVVRLEEERLASVETWIDVGLALGRHRELISELRSLIIGYPLRERLWEQLMLALYRAGRQAEALATYHAARHSLSDLGIAPGPELQRMQQNILNENPALLRFAGSQSKTGKIAIARLPPAGPDEKQPAHLWRPVHQRTPRQGPPESGDFIGRVEQIEQIRSYLTDKSAEKLRVVVITGMAGIGKTALAVHLIHRLRPQFPDGQLYATLRRAAVHAVAPGDILSQFLRALGMAGTAIPEDVEERASLYRTLLADRRLLVVLDDVVDESQVEPLLPGTPSAAVIVTSRSRLTARGSTYQVELDTLGDDQALELLINIVGSQRARAEPSASREVIRLSGGLPLALRICGAKLAARPYWKIEALARRLTDERLRLNELAHSHLGVRASFALSYQGLSRDAQRLFCLLGLLNMSDFPGWVSAALLDTSVPQAEDVTNQLIDARLLEIVDHGAPKGTRYCFHDLIRWYSQQECGARISATERTEALTRAFGAYLALAEEAHRRAFGGDYMLTHGTAFRWRLHDTERRALLANPLAWFEIERENIVAIIRQTTGPGFDEFCWDLTTTAATLFATFGYYSDWQDTHERALSAMRAAGNRRGEASVLRVLSGLHIFQRRFGEAVIALETAHQMLTEVGDIHGAALALVGLGISERRARNFDQSLLHLERALVDLRKHSDPVNEAHVLRNIGQIHLSQGSAALASSYLARARTIARDIKSKPIEGYVEYWIAETHLSQGNLVSAVAVFGDSHEIAREIGDKRQQALSLHGLGRAHLRLSHAELAEGCLRRASVIANTANERLVEARILLDLGRMRHNRERSAQAMRDLRRAGDLFGEQSVLDREAQALELLAAIQERVADDASGSQLPALPPARSGRTDGAADAHHGATVRVGTPESPGIQGSGAAESR